MKYYHTFQIFEPDLKKDRIREEFAQSTWKYLYEHGVIPTYRSNYSRNSKDYGDDSDGCFFKDVINDAIEKAEDTDVIIYTNTDSCLPKNIFKLVESKIKDYGCCYGKRRELSDILPGRHLTDDEIQAFPYTKYGACIFAFTKKWWVENQHKLADCILPKGMWDNNLTYLIKQISLNTRLDNSVYHIAHASTWVRGLSDKGIVLCKTLAQEDLLKLTFLNFLRKGYESIHTDNYESVTTRFCTRVYEIFDAMDSMNFPMESWFQSEMDKFESNNSSIPDYKYKFELNVETEGNKYFLNRDLFDNIENRFQLEHEMYKFYKDTPHSDPYLVAPLDFFMECSDKRVTNEILNTKHEKIADNMFTFATQDNIAKILDFLNDVGVTKLYWTNVEKNFRQYKNVELLPIPYVIKDEFPLVEKDIMYSFVGFPGSHPSTREPIDEVKSNHKVYIKLNAEFHENSKYLNMAFHYDIVRRNEVNKNLHTQENLDANKKNKQHYIDILSRSVFSICPRGSNAGSNRFWESIKAGSIPILIADDWVLPEYDWENTIIRIKEKDWVAGISNDSYFIDNIIKTVDIETLRSNCLKYNMDFYKPNINVTGVLTVDGVM